MRSKIYLMLILVASIAAGQCIGITGNGISKSYGYRSCYDTVKVTSYLNTVIADTTSVTKLTVTNLSNGLLKSTSGVLSTATAGSDYLGYSGTTGQVSYFTSANAIGGSSNLFWNNTSKKLGIGTSSPEANLSIIGTSATNKMWSVRKYGTLYAHQIVDTGAVVYGIGLLNQTYLALENTEATPDPQLRIINNAGATTATINAYSASNSATKHTLQLASSGVILLNNTNNDNLHHTSTGNIGFGTTNPGATLPNGAVAGAKVLELSSASGTRDVVMSLTGNSAAVSADWWLDRSVGHSYLDNRYDDVSSKIGLRLRTTGTPVEAMSLWGTGNIGVGLTTTPGARLHVLSTTEQQRTAYDASNYESKTVSSSGSVTYALTGTSPTFTFSQNIRPAASIVMPSTSTAFDMYNTADETTNFERLRLNRTSNVFTLLSSAGGSGSIRDFQIGVNTTAIRSFLITTTASKAGQYRFSGTTSGVDNSALGVNTAFTSTSGTNQAVAIVPTINQSSTAAYAALWIAPYEQTTGSGTKLLIDAGTSSAADGATYTSKFKVDNTGKEIHEFTYTAGGTTGNQTINKVTGSVNIAAAGTSVTVTNSTVTTSSIVQAWCMTNDATAYVKSVVVSSGSFTINIAAATAETKIGFKVTN
jgi:hypothetical protein